MPHDRDGQEVKPGDRVLVECVVKSVQMTEEYCNITVETVNVMPGNDTPSTFALNTKQTKLIGR